MNTLKERISNIINSKPTLNLYFVLKNDDGFEIKRADIDNENAEPALNDMFKNNIQSKLIDNDELTLINLSDADERINAIYEYDYIDYPDELSVIKDFDINSVVDYNTFNFRDDDVSKIFAFLIYIGTMTNGIVLFKKHYHVTMIKRGTLLLYKRGERLVKFDDSDVFKMNGDFNIFKVDNKLYIKDLSVLENNCGFDELIKNRATQITETIAKKGIIDNIDKFRQSASDITYAKKLAKVYKKSPVIKSTITNKQIIEFCKNNPVLKDTFKYTSDGKKFVLDTKKSKIAFVKLLNDDYLISELTKLYYDSVAKDNLSTNKE